MCNKHNVYGDCLSKKARITKIRIDHPKRAGRPRWPPPSHRKALFTTEIKKHC